MLASFLNNYIQFVNEQVAQTTEMNHYFIEKNPSQKDLNISEMRELSLTVALVSETRADQMLDIACCILGLGSNW